VGAAPLTRNLTAVQLTDARDKVATAYESVANLNAEEPVDLQRLALLTQTMTDVIHTLNVAGAAVRAVPEQPEPQSLGQRLTDSADLLDREYR